MDCDELDTLLKKWNDAKYEISILEKKIDKYKRATEKLMNKSNINSLEGNFMIVNRRNITRSSITKRDVPVKIWNEYSRTMSYPAYYINKKK
tara:strand:- start:142 stop:417 length:276 start_codon:yes stop_codon:yes gene_type:complete